MQQQFPQPASARDLVQLLALFDGRAGVHSVVNALAPGPGDTTALYQVMYGDTAAAQAARERAGDDAANPRDVLRNFLTGADLARRIRNLVADAFPDKRRAIFVHIPKCAGTDLTDALRRRFAAFRELDYRPHVDKPDARLQSLRDLVLGIMLTDTICFTGHERLTWYVRNNMVREGDHIFTVIREPVALIYSYVNYILTICSKPETVGGTDAQRYLRMLGITRFDTDLTDAYMHDMAHRVLHCKPAIQPNHLATFLGDGTARGATKTIIASNIEITDTSRYAAWRTERFGFAASPRRNASKPFYTPHTASAEDRAYIDAICLEDKILYIALHDRLERAGGVSITGRMLR